MKISNNRQFVSRLLVLALMLLATVDASAQAIKAYVASGFTTSQIEGDELRGFDKWGGTFGVGALANLSQDHRWKFGIEADYATRGAKNTSGNPYSVRIPLRYADIPATFYYHDPKGGMTFGMGFTYGRLVQQPHDTIAFGEAFIPDTTAFHFGKNDFSLHAEVRFQVWEWVFLSFRYQRSFMPINEMSFLENGKSWTNKCYNSTIQGRLVFQFGDPNDDYRGKGKKYKKHHRR